MRPWAWWACLVTVFVGWGAACLFVSRSYSPPPEVQTLDSFVNYFGKPERFERMGNDHFVATLSVPSWHIALNLPSDLPQYVFDRSGRLVDWSADPGDDPGFQARWPKERRSSLLLGPALESARVGAATGVKGPDGSTPGRGIR